MRDRGLSPRHQTSSDLIAPALLVLAAVAVYHGSYSVPFFFDDVAAITNNPTIRDLRQLGTVLSPPGDGGGMTGRPIVNLSLALNYALSGTDVRSYHLLNLVLHALSAVTLFGILRRTLALTPLPGTFGPMGSRMAFLVALLWTVHPLQTESVTCVIQRTEILVTVFYLLTLYSFIRSVSAATPRPWQIISVVACALGMASKEVMVSAPVIVLLYDRTFLAGSFRAAWQARRGFHLGLAATWLVLAALLIGMGGSRGMSAGFGLGVSWWSYALKQCEAIITYLRLSLWPHPLVIDYGTQVVQHPLEVVPQALLLVMLVVATFVALWKRPVIGFALFMFFSVLAPSSSVVPLVSQTIAEHRMYLPVALLLALGIAGGFRIIGARILTSGIALAVALGLATAARNEIMQDEVRLWRDTIAKVPGNARAHGSLGFAYANRGQSREALPHYQRALELDPKSIATEQNIGNAYYRLGDHATALAHYRRTVALDPGFAGGHKSIGAALLDLGDSEGALRHYRRALELDPENAGAQENVARALFTLNRFAEAAAHYERVVHQTPDSADAHYQLGLSLVRAGDAEEATQHFNNALRLRPSAGLYLNVARFLANAGKTSEAISNLEAALRLQPDLIEARRELERLRR